MLTKSIIRSVGIVLGTLFFVAGTAVSHAESQSEWLQKQLQLSDGSVPEFSAPVQRSANKPSPYEGTGMEVRAVATEKPKKADKPATQISDGG